MSFRRTLDRLLRANDGASAVLFLDDSGEVIDLVCSAYDPYSMKIVGAYVGIYLRQLRSLLARAEMGEPRLLHIEKEKAHFYAAALPDGYYLVLIQDRPALVARACETLDQARREITEEIFTDG